MEMPLSKRLVLQFVLPGVLQIKMWKVTTLYQRKSLQELAAGSSGTVYHKSILRRKFSIDLKDPLRLYDEGVTNNA